MKSTQKCIGECPSCGDELYIFKTRNYKRLVKCINETCPEQFAYGIPKKGKIEITGIQCPKFKLPLLAVIPINFIAKGKFRPQEKHVFFWTKSPCFTCSSRSTCSELNEAIDDYEN